MASLPLKGANWCCFLQLWAVEFYNVTVTIKGAEVILQFIQQACRNDLMSFALFTLYSFKFLRSEWYHFQPILLFPTAERSHFSGSAGVWPFQCCSLPELIFCDSSSNRKRVFFFLRIKKIWRHTQVQQWRWYFKQGVKSVLWQIVDSAEYREEICL